VELQHYSPSEFGVWWPFMSDRLLAKLDRFRERWGEPVQINAPNRGGLGRVGRKHRESMHYVGPTKKRAVHPVRAADITPQGIESPADMRRAYQAAVDAGFTGIGLYPGKAARWNEPGLHVDVRGNRKVGDPAMWSRINRKSARRALGLDPDGDPYVALSLALDPVVWRA